MHPGQQPQQIGMIGTQSHLYNATHTHTRMNPRFTQSIYLQKPHAYLFLQTAQRQWLFSDSTIANMPPIQVKRKHQQITRISRCRRCVLSAPARSANSSARVCTHLMAWYSRRKCPKKNHQNPRNASKKAKKT